jgi:hypothetical protein
LSIQDLEHLFAAGALGMGQEFSAKFVQENGELAPVPAKLLCNSPCSGTDMVQCSEVDPDGLTVRIPAINPYTCHAYRPSPFPYYVYEIETRCDSGD